MSLEIRPLAAVYPPPYNFFLTDTTERGANVVGMNIPPPEPLRSRPYKALICMGGGITLGKGQFSREITPFTGLANFISVGLNM